MDSPLLLEQKNTALSIKDNAAVSKILSFFRNGGAAVGTCYRNFAPAARHTQGLFAMWATVIAVISVF